MGSEGLYFDHVLTPYRWTHGKYCDKGPRRLCRIRIHLYGGLLPGRLVPAIPQLLVSGCRCGTVERPRL